MRRRSLTAEWMLLALPPLLLASSGIVGAGAQATPPAARTAAPTTGYRAEFLHELAQTEDHYLRLAEAIPADKYGWRPAPGVRSVSEVFMHVAAANFGLPRLIGTPPPAGFDVQGFERSTADKAQVAAALRRSFAHLRGAALSLSDGDADRTFPWFDGQNSYRGLLLFITRHSAEHLGQSIAYARVNGVVPPWSE